MTDTQPTCPFCGHVVNSASPADVEEAAPPEKGDFSVCLYCAEVSVFADDAGTLRKATPEDLEGLDEKTHNELINAALFIHRRIAFRSLSPRSQK